MRFSLLAALGVLSSACLLSGCQFVTGVDDLVVTGAGGGASTTSASSAMMTATSTGSGPIDCGDVTCPMAPACKVAACVGGKCMEMNAGSGTPCGDGPKCSADGNQTVPQGTCNEGGSCSQPMAQSCGGFACDPMTGACFTTCSAEVGMDINGCAPDFYCSNNSGQGCQPKKDLGEDCTANGQCTSAACVDQHCCGEASCDGACKSCNPMETGGPVGLCLHVLMGHDPDDDCAGQLTCLNGGGCG